MGVSNILKWPATVSVPPASCKAFFKNPSPSPGAELPKVGICCLNSESIYLFSASYQLCLFPLKWKSTVWTKKDQWCLRKTLPEHFTVYCKGWLLFMLVVCQTATWATILVTKQVIMFSQSHRKHTRHSDCHTAIPWLQVFYGFSCCSCGYIVHCEVNKL